MSLLRHDYLTLALSLTAEIISATSYTFGPYTALLSRQNSIPDVDVVRSREHIKNCSGASCFVPVSATSHFAMFSILQ